MCCSVRSPGLAPRGLLWLRAVHGEGFPGGSVVVNLPASAGDMGLIPGSGRSPGEGNATHFSILALEIPGIEEPGGL